MGSSSDMPNAIIIIIIFVIINVVSVLGMSIQHIKDNWNRYKCMPLVIPFANVFGKSPSKTLSECIANIANESLGSMLGPVYTLFSQISSIGGEIGSFMNIFNNMSNVFKFSFLNVIEDSYEIATKTVLGLTQFTYTIQDMVNKLLGIFTIVIYIFAGANITVMSIWNGLPGQLVKAVSNL